MTTAIPGPEYAGGRLAEAGRDFSALIEKYPDLAISLIVHDTEARDGLGNTMHAMHLPTWSVAQFDRRTYREGVLEEIGVAVNLDPNKQAQLQATMAMFEGISTAADKLRLTCANVMHGVEREAQARRAARGEDNAL